MRPLVLVLLALSARPAGAQPAADAVLAAWQAAWDAAARDVEAVAFAETLSRTITGPRRTLTVDTEGSLRLRPLLRPRRTVRHAAVNGEPIAVDDLPRLGRGLRRALGPVATDLRRPAPLPSRLFASAEPVGPASPERVDGRDAWRVTLVRARRRGPPERVSAWFTTSAASPRLLRTRRERPLRHRDVLVRTTDYARHRGLDLPTAHTVEADVEQRRRLRSYTVSLRAEARYSEPEVASGTSAAPETP